MLQRHATHGSAGAAFLIGGALGLADEVLRAADRRMRLSTFTFPHDIARLMLAEQLYRAGTIVRGEPYHKGSE
jgi:23S rRNA (pseudouridine1915-N3)-methyltransferase